MGVISERATIEEVNGLDREEFVSRFGGLYEDSPWVAEAAWHERPFASFAEVIAAHAFGGEIQPPANKDFDLKTEDGFKIQVKSLRISSTNPRGWRTNMVSRPSSQLW